MSADDIRTALLKLNALPEAWRNHASGEGSALYRAGFDHCALELEGALEALKVALNELAREPQASNEPSYIKCLHCTMKSYHPKDLEECYCANCHLFHAPGDVGLTFEIGPTPVTGV